jgi:(2Fe-2S) ferredoxin
MDNEAGCHKELQTKTSDRSRAVRSNVSFYKKHRNYKSGSMSGVEFIEDCDRLVELAPIAAADIQHHVFVCTGKSCSANDSAEVKSAFERELKARGLQYGKVSKGCSPNGTVVLTECASVGFCAIGAAVMVYPDGVWYAQVRPADVPEIVEEHILNGRPVERLALLRVPSKS